MSTLGIRCAGPAGCRWAALHGRRAPAFQFLAHPPFSRGSPQSRNTLQLRPLQGGNNKGKANAEPLQIASCRDSFPPPSLSFLHSRARTSADSCWIPPVSRRAHMCYQCLPAKCRAGIKHFQLLCGKNKTAADRLKKDLFQTEKSRAAARCCVNTSGSEDVHCPPFRWYLSGIWVFLSVLILFYQTSLPTQCTAGWAGG